MILLSNTDGSYFQPPKNFFTTYTESILIMEKTLLLRVLSREREGEIFHKNRPVFGYEYLQKGLLRRMWHELPFLYKKNPKNFTHLPVYTLLVSKPKPQTSAPGPHFLISKLTSGLSDPCCNVNNDYGRFSVSLYYFQLMIKK